MEIATKQVRAKSGYILGKRRDKGGRIHDTKTHQVASMGMHSAKEMEKVMREVAIDVGASEDQIRIETYQHGESPLEVNPRHRGSPDTIYFRGERRRVFGGFNPKRDR